MMKRKRRDNRSFKESVLEKSSFFQHHPWIFYPLIAIVSLATFTALMIAILSRNLPSLAELEVAGDPLLVTRIYSSDGKILDELFLQKRIKVPLIQMPDNLIKATIASEDRRFWRHWGLDFRRIAKMAFVNITSLKIRGGASTLTQQLARKVYLTPRKSIIRKIREQLTAIQIERTYSKSEILEMYLNQMPLGRGAHGVQAAAQAYFGKNVENLTVEESAVLVGLLQLPYGWYSPDRNPEAALKRRNVVLKSMVSCGYLTQAEYDSVSQLKLGVIDNKNEQGAIAPYFCEYVRQLMQDKYGLRLYTDGLSIYTTLDTRVQACADSAMNAFVPSLEKEIWHRFIKNHEFTNWLDPPLDTPEKIRAFLADSALVDSVMEARATVQSALIALHPNSGHILAMIGGRDFKKWKYNRAVQMARQPGSAFKPFAYTTAIDNGWPTTTELLNQPVVIIMPDGTRWSPKNYDNSTGGPTTFREALRLSLNMVAARLIQEVIPPQKVATYAKHFGFTTTINPYDGIALGQDVVIPIELTSAFSVFANRGVLVDPIAVLRVEDKDGNVLEEATPRRREVISEETASIMTDLLSTVINKGTGSAARWRYQFYRPAAGKTGTTNDFRNAWFVGFTPQICAGVWIGFDDERISLGKNQTGANTALPVWAPFMQMVHDTLHLPLAEFVMPPGVVRLKICSQSKKIATPSCPEIWDEVFVRDMAPADTCDIHRGPEKNRDWRKKSDRIIF